MTMTHESVGWMCPQPALPPTPLSPTLWQLELLLALVEHSTYPATAEAIGVTESALQHNMLRLFERLGTSSRAEAVRLTWPILGEHYVLPVDHPRFLRRAG